MSSETSINESQSQLQPSDWGDHLPSDILDLILNNLLRLSDYRRFSSVCKHWRSVAQTQSHLRLDPNDKQLPLLFIPNTSPSQSQSQSPEPPRTEPESEPRVEPGLYDLKTRSILHDIKLQWRYHQRCCGSSFGWLATTNMFFEVYFTNPFTGQTLKFPTLSLEDLYPDENDLTYLTPEDLDELYLIPEDHKVFKAIMSKDPHLFPDDYVIVAIHYDYLRFSLTKPGTKYWVEIENKGLGSFSDVIVYKGLVYGVTFHGGLGCIDVSGDFDYIDIKSKLQVIIPSNMEYAQTAYLVESSQGELLQVRMFSEDDMLIEDETHLKFDVLKLVEEEGKMKWFAVESLGEDALFVGDNYSMSILASNFPNYICNSNCIYFPNNFYHHGYSYDERNRWFDIGIYNVSDRSFQLHSLMPSSFTRLLPPIWIQPL